MKLPIWKYWPLLENICNPPFGSPLIPIWGLNFAHVPVTGQNSAQNSVTLLVTPTVKWYQLEATRAVPSVFSLGKPRSVMLQGGTRPGPSPPAGMQSSPEHPCTCDLGN